MKLTQKLNLFYTFNRHFSKVRNFKIAFIITNSFLLLIATNGFRKLLASLFIQNSFQRRMSRVWLATLYYRNYKRQFCGSFLHLSSRLFDIDFYINTKFQLYLKKTKQLKTTFYCSYAD